MTPAVIVAVALRLGAAPDVEHLTTVAEAISSASLAATCSGPWVTLGCTRVWPGSRGDLEALLVVIGVRESGFRKRIAEGDCRKRECDNGRARHYWQAHVSSWLPLDSWSALVGADYYTTVVAAYVAARTLGSGLAHCGTIEGAVSAYARGACTWRGAAARVRDWERVR